MRYLGRSSWISDCRTTTSSSVERKNDEEYFISSPWGGWGRKGKQTFCSFCWESRTEKSKTSACAPISWAPILSDRLSILTSQASISCRFASYLMCESHTTRRYEKLINKFDRFLLARWCCSISDKHQMRQQTFASLPASLPAPIFVSLRNLTSRPTARGVVLLSMEEGEDFLCFNCKFASDWTEKLNKSLHTATNRHKSYCIN